MRKGERRQGKDRWNEKGIEMNRQTGKDILHEERQKGRRKERKRRRTIGETDREKGRKGEED